jgi:hypothetical protein
MSRALKTLFLLGLVLAASALISGCGQKRVTEFQAAQARLAEDPTALDGKFQAEVILCRRVGKKSKRPIGVGTEFVMKESSRVSALVKVANVELGETNAFHLVWIKPGEKEVTRRYAEVKVESSEEGYRTLVQWKKANDLHYLKERVQESEEISFVLTSSLNTSLKKEREPGTYRFRLYFNRELLIEETFELTSA